MIQALSADKMMSFKKSFTLLWWSNFMCFTATVAMNKLEEIHNFLVLWIIDYPLKMIITSFWDDQIPLKEIVFTYLSTKLPSRAYSALKSPQKSAKNSEITFFKRMQYEETMPGVHKS